MAQVKTVLLFSGTYKVLFVTELPDGFLMDGLLVIQPPQNTDAKDGWYYDPLTGLFHEDYHDCSPEVIPLIVAQEPPPPIPPPGDEVLPRPDPEPVPDPGTEDTE